MYRFEFNASSSKRDEIDGILLHRFTVKTSLVESLHGTGLYTLFVLIPEEYRDAAFQQLCEWMRSHRITNNMTCLVYY